MALYLPKDELSEICISLEEKQRNPNYGKTKSNFWHPARRSEENANRQTFHLIMGA